ncbi:4-(cytidine 5'-diphospho)-2-C-methyl-D-erythritol kinase [Pelagibacterales bacterium SAG-MED47]|nr:4-(cytidine 5'-diphospho)-2-C-methyl-D-erythritol kinase [Pelagibacterales bacterium SAG-MED47]
MKVVKIKSHAKLNLALNITGKTSSLHKIETMVTFAYLHDQIFIKRIESDKHNIVFSGKFSENIGKNNTISKLLNILEKKKLLKNKKFRIEIIKLIPSKAGLGGGSMNAANILNYFVKKKIITVSKKKILIISRSIGSDVILGLKVKNSILNEKKKIKYFTNNKKFFVLIVKPDFGCSTKDIYSKVKKFNKPKFNRPTKKMFALKYLKGMSNSLEPVVFSKYNKLRKIKLFLEKLSTPAFVRMTGSGSALVAYFQSKETCENAKKEFIKKYKNYWCIASKTI